MAALTGSSAFFLAVPDAGFVRGAVSVGAMADVATGAGVTGEPPPPPIAGLTGAPPRTLRVVEASSVTPAADVAIPAMRRRRAETASPESRLPRGTGLLYACRSMTGVAFGTLGFDVHMSRIIGPPEA